MASALKTALELSQSGRSDSEVSSEMKEMGFSAREINEAINEANIKKSITEKPISGTSEMSEMEPSIMEKSSEEEMEVPVPSAQTAYKKVKQEKTEQAPYGYQQEAAPYSPQQYQQVQEPQYYSEQPQQQNVDIELVEEISEEIVNEKFTELNAKIGDIPAFKQSVEKRIDDVEDRLKRIEANLDKIQIALLGKIREYGDNVKTLSSEIQTVENSFSKIIDPLISNVKELNSITEKIKERANVKVAKGKK